MAAARLQLVYVALYAFSITLSALMSFRRRQLITRSYLAHGTKLTRISQSSMLSKKIMAVSILFTTDSDDSDVRCK